MTLVNINKLSILIDEISELEKLPWTNPKTLEWINDVFWHLKSEFGEDSDYYEQFNDAVKGPVMVASETQEQVFQKRYLERLESYILLESFLEQIITESKSQI